MSPSEEKIIQTIDVSFNTAAVGTLEILEQEFGFLWGHGKNMSELTEDEQYYRSIWDQVRRKIFGRSEKAKAITINKTENHFLRKTQTFKDFS